MNPYLNMEQIVVSDIETSSKTPAEKRQAYFQRWRKEKGSGANYRKIIIACLKRSNRNGAEEILKLFKSHSTERNCCDQGKNDFIIHNFFSCYVLTMHAQQLILLGSRLIPHASYFTPSSRDLSLFFSHGGSRS